MQDKAQIIAALRKIFGRWQDALAGMSEEQINAAIFDGGLSIKDVLAHLTIWQKISVARMEAAGKDREPDYPYWPTEEIDPESPEELNRLNAWIFETNHGRPWADIYQEWRDRFAYLLVLCEAFPEKELLEVDRYAWLKGYALAAVLVGTFEHHDEHMDDWVALMGRPGSSGFQAEDGNG